MAAVAGPVSGLVIPEAIETIRRERAPWFVRCPPSISSRSRSLIGDSAGNLGFVVPLRVAACLSAGALVLFLIRTPSVGVAISAIAIAAVTTKPAYHLMTPMPDALSIRHFDEGAMLIVEGHLIREAERFPDKMRLYVDVDRAAEEGAAARPAHGVIRLTMLHSGPFRLGDRVRFQGRIRFARNFAIRVNSITRPSCGARPRRDDARRERKSRRRSGGARASSDVSGKRVRGNPHPHRDVHRSRSR